MWKVPSLVFGSFLSLFTKHERRRKLEKRTFKRMRDGRSEWRGTSGLTRVTAQYRRTCTEGWDATIVGQKKNERKRGWNPWKSKKMKHPKHKPRITHFFTVWKSISECSWVKLNLVMDVVYIFLLQPSWKQVNCFPFSLCMSQAFLAVVFFTTVFFWVY